MVATLAKMAVPTYYIESQAAHEGYYTGGGKERPGEWHNPAGLFGLKNGGIVWEKKFYALCAGHSPELDGTDLVNGAGSDKRSPGFDMTFSVDKSISALWAIEPRAEERGKIERAVIDAARCALDETVFRHCATTRVGKTGKDLRVETGDMLAATFLHRTSREGDPQLHVHATIFNVVKTHSDGKCRALHGYPLYSWSKAAGATFRARLAEIVQQRLGIAMERHGPEGEYSRVREMDPELEQAWSKRRAEIVAAVAENLGEEALSNPAQMAAATLATRSHKPEGGPTTEEDIERFLVEAAEIVDLEELRTRIRSAEIPEITEERIEEIRKEIEAIPERLARMEAVFNFPNIVEKTENALATAAGRGSMERWREVCLGNAELLSLDYPEPGIEAQAGMAHKRIFTTRDTLRAERTLRHISGLSVSDRTHAVEPEKVEKLLEDLRNRGKQFSAEQRKAIEHVAADSGRIALIEGAAGSGKSTVLGPLADLWRAEGRKVRALAVAWSVAVELATDMNAPPSAVHPFLRDVARGNVELGPDTVLVVDEAGMLSTRQTLQLARLSEQTGCKLVLVGDTQQQQPIEAGPGMRIVRDRVKGVRIDRIRRQVATLEDWLREVDGLPAEEAMEKAAAMTREEREAARERFRAMNRERRKAGEKPLRIERPWQLGISALLRHGAMQQAFTELHKRGRLTLAEGKEDALLRLVAFWSAWSAENPEREAVVMARTRADVRALNALLRARHHAATGSADYDPARDSAVIRIHRFRDRGKAAEDDFEVRVGDRLRIGSTVPHLGLYNRDVVTVTGLEKRHAADGAAQVLITARTRDRQTRKERTIRFEPGEIRNYIGETTIDYAYAATTTAAQGLTLDAAFLLLDEGMARETTYPAATRHTRRLQVVADRLPAAIAIAGATPDGEPGREVSDEEVLDWLGRLCGRSQPKLAAIDHILAANQPEMPLQGELEIGREPVPTATAANDSLQPGTAGIGPRAAEEAPGAAVRRHADRAAVQRIIADARRQVAQSPDLAAAAALAADMEDVEREWSAIPAPAESAAAPDTAQKVRLTLDRHLDVLARVRVFLRSGARAAGETRPRVSGEGAHAFALFRRRMKRRWAGALDAEARLAKEAERQARTRSLAGPLDRDWSELRSRTGPDILAFLEDQEHAGLLRRTVELAADREIDRDTARSWRDFLDGHYAALGAELTRAWKQATPLRQNTVERLSPESVSGYGRLMRQAHAFVAALDAASGLPGDRRAETTLWRRRLQAAPAYQDILIGFIKQWSAEEALMRRREELLPGSTLPTRRLADHMATLNGFLALDGFGDESRKKIRQLVRQHQQARRDASVTRTDAPWPSDEQIESRIATERGLREDWRAIRAAMRDDPLAALEYPHHGLLIDRTARHAADPSLDADTARKQSTFLADHIRQLDTALEEARASVRQPDAAPGYGWAEFRQYDRLRWRAARLSVDLMMVPDDLPVPRLAGRKWQDWLDATPDTSEAFGMLVRSIEAEDAAIRDREALLPGSTLPTRRLHDHMENLRALSSLQNTRAFCKDDERAGAMEWLESWEKVREAAGVSRTDGRWLSDRAAAHRVEHLALERAWHEIGPGVIRDQLKVLDRPDHRDLIARTVAFASEPGLREDHAQKWRKHVEGHLYNLNAELKDMRHGRLNDIERQTENFRDFDRYVRLRDRVRALAGIIRQLPAGFQRPDFSIQAWRDSLAAAPDRIDVWKRFMEKLGKEEAAIRTREAEVPGSTLPTRRLADHMAVLEALASHDQLGARNRDALQGILDAHRRARADAGVTATRGNWARSAEEHLARECRHIQTTFERAIERRAGKAIIYVPGFEAVHSDIDRLLANPHLSSGDRRTLEDCKAAVEPDIRVRNEIRRTIEHASSHVREYTDILDRHRAGMAGDARRGPEPAEPAKPGLRGWVERRRDTARARRDASDPARIESERRRKEEEARPKPLSEINSEYRIWSRYADSLVETFDRWLAADDPRHADHVDRRRIDIADLRGELAAICKAGLVPGGEPHRVEIPDAGRSGMENQYFDAERVTAILPDALRPEGERDLEALAELARWNRAWPKQTLAAFRAFLDDAERSRDRVSTWRLAFDLPPGLAAGFGNLSAESHKRHAKAIGQRQELTRGFGLSH